MYIIRTSTLRCRLASASKISRMKPPPPPVPFKSSLCSVTHPYYDGVSLPVTPLETTWFISQDDTEFLFFTHSPALPSPKRPPSSFLIFLMTQSIPCTITFCQNHRTAASLLNLRPCYLPPPNPNPRRVYLLKHESNAVRENAESLRRCSLRATI